MSKIKLLLGASALLFSSLSHSSPITDTVLVDGTIWAQPTGFIGLSWDSINEVCPEDNSGICKAEQLLGNDMYGWVWASIDDVANLLVSLDVPLDLREVDSSWAPVVMNTFNSVSGLSYEVVWGMTRTSHPVANFASFAPIIIDGNDGLVDVVNIGNPDDKSTENFERGGWFYREISPVPAAIDIKPGSDPNCFNINSHGVIPVAILGSDSFDVTQIAQDSLSFGGLEVRVRGNKGPLCRVDYSDGDEYLDLVCQFEDNSDYWSPGDGEATLTGSLINGGGDFEGTDSICVVP